MLSKREGLILYWCEGSKTNSTVSVVSLDFEMLNLFIDWLCKYYDAKRDNFKIRLQIWEGMDEDKCKSFWSEKLNLSLFKFHKTYFKKKTKTISYTNKKFGICDVRYCKQKISHEIIKNINDEFHTSIPKPLTRKEMVLRREKKLNELRDLEIDCSNQSLATK